MEYQQTRQQLAGLLQTGRRVTVRWDCGYDEALVYTRIDGRQVDSVTDFASELVQLVIEKLDLPGASDFSVTGHGQFFLQHNAVGLAYALEAVQWDHQEYWEQLDDDAVVALLLSLSATAPAAGKNAAGHAVGGRINEKISDAFSSRRILFEIADTQ